MDDSALVLADELYNCANVRDFAVGSVDHRDAAMSTRQECPRSESGLRLRYGSRHLRLADSNRRLPPKLTENNPYVHQKDQKNCIQGDSRVSWLARAKDHRFDSLQVSFSKKVPWSLARNPSVLRRGCILVLVRVARFCWIVASSLIRQ
jgi:hypothetical protein